ncbi:MAG: hypothetical protein U0T73_02410 [Chitinophagales bacterium]
MKRIEKKLWIGVLAFALTPIFCFAQNSIAAIKHKPCKLRGSWQLVRTFSDGKLHDVEKNEYDAVIRMKCFHRFEEEVWYEGYHWIIEGKWYTRRKTDSLCFVQRVYTYGKLEDKPADIRYNLTELSREFWTGQSVAEGNRVELRYKKFKPKRKSKTVHSEN